MINEEEMVSKLNITRDIRKDQNKPEIEAVLNHTQRSPVKRH